MMPNIIWWTVFLCAGVWAQSVFPGVDILAAGLVISMQEERLQQTAWLMLACIIIQEGAGSLAFGYSLVWYVFVVGLYILGRWLFEARNLLFILLLGLCLGIMHVVLSSTLASLQNYEVDIAVLLREGFLQALLFAPAWGFTYALRPKRAQNDVARA